MHLVDGILPGKVSMRTLWLTLAEAPNGPERRHWES